jgi:Tfp pilus assembly PilM family ATPase
MSQYLALEWDANEARIAVARNRGKDVTIEHAFTVQLGEPAAAGAGAGQKIAEALRQRNIGRVETLVAVGRTSIELRQLSLPPSPPDEMPELVRFQALRQFTTIGEDWPLDFVQLDTESTESTSVLAAAISPDLVAQIRATCQGAELTPKRLVLRPFAAASLLRRHDRDSSHPCRLMVDLLTEEADLTVLDDKHVVLMRTVRLPSTDNIETQGRSLLGEIRRTIAAASNQLHGRRVERVILCGEGTDQAALKALVEQELSLTVQFFNPFDDLTLGSNLRANRPSHAGRFAPLLGMLLDEAAGATHAIDFLHPRKKPEPVNTRRQKVLIAATVAVMAMAGVLLVMMQLDSADGEIAQLRSQISGIKSKVVTAEKQRLNTAAVQDFVDNDINWLEELKGLSLQLPSEKDVLVTQLTAGTRVTGGGQISVEGFVRESAQIKEVQQSLRANNRKVVSTGGHEDPRRAKDKYTWRFDETVMIAPGQSATVTESTKTEPASATARANDKTGGSTK